MDNLNWYFIFMIVMMVLVTIGGIFDSNNNKNKNKSNSENCQYEITAKDTHDGKDVKIKVCGVLMNYE